MGKIISVFSHKGGVGKTTLVHNLGFLLANKGKKVLLIDADSQMNLTSAVAGFSTETRYKNDNARWKEFLNKHTNIAKFIKSLDEKKKAKVFEDLYCKSHIYQYKNKHNAVNKIKFSSVKANEILKFESQNGVLNLLPSAVGKNVRTDDNSNNIVAERLSNIPKIELALARALNPEDAGAMLIPKIHDAINDLSKKYDFILIDTAPNASSILNAVLMMSSNYFILVGRPDFFSLQAIDNMDDIFQNWAVNLKSWLSTPNSKGILNYPKFLGLVAQMCRRYGADEDDNHLSADHITEWNEAINKSVAEFVRSYSKNHIGTTLDTEEEFFTSIFPTSNPFIIKSCCDFTHKLRSISEKAGIPVTMLNNAICEENRGKGKVTVVGDDKENKYQQAFQSITRDYSYIAEGLLKL